ncbi:Uncharacterized membrane protein YccC [Nakamurella panacisegetis]|uniref:Uncharacterized membrane protein YccC n=1 Tax=Nakamurella panacisegetis TaxID=1090615 RepID=A0A1H0HJS9_9ACTN|nr:FUSC family protein [Nakamurella panacisegetis]SDO19347.1 Uncharacterized membrane protein YccC [Nakamurella panacisegetis]
MHLMSWLAARDRGFSALRRAARTAIIMPAMFALGDKIFDDPNLATYAAFGSFAMLMLVDFGGPVRDRVQAQIALSVVGAVFVCLGTLVSNNTWSAGIAMAVVGFAVLFAGVVSSVLAAAGTSLLLSFILPVSLSAPLSTLPARLAGWGLASAVAVVAIAVLWPAPPREVLRGPAAAACRAIAVRLRAEAEFVLGGRHDTPEHQAAIAAATTAVASLQKAFIATPNRPTGLSTSARAVVRLVDELKWLDAILAAATIPRNDADLHRAACAVKISAADVLDAGSDLLEVTGGDPSRLHRALSDLEAALLRLEQGSTEVLPVLRAEADGRIGDAPADETPTEFLSALDPSFRAQELTFAVRAVAGNIDLAGAAERRSWIARLLGRQPAGFAGPVAAAGQRAVAHFDRHSVWLHNSIRGGIGLGVAVLVADLSAVQHSFWVVLATLSVLRSNALNTGQNALRGLAGTLVGFVVGAGLLALVGTSPAALWVLLPISILFAGLAPAVISFVAGQAAFTVVIVILFNLIAPAGWKVGLLRVEDIAIGCAVSLVVGALFWPRGAGAALGRALAEAYTDGAAYLADAVLFGVLRCDPAGPAPALPNASSQRAAAASRRLDDTFRTYLAEKGSKPVPLAEVTTLVTGTAALRLSADAVLDLWQRDDGAPGGDRTTARQALLGACDLVTGWYRDLAAGFVDGRPIPEPAPHDPQADARLVRAVRADLHSPDGAISGTAVRVIWTGDHLDAARRLQALLAPPARSAQERRAADPTAPLLTGHLHLRRGVIVSGRPVPD